jgi:HEPN domain-containing protein
MTILDFAMEWLRYAKSDLNTARHMFNDVNPKETEISCYHTQQCAEKSLKAYLIAHGTEAPRTHDLVELNKLCTEHEASFSVMQQHCVSLNPYSVHVRYPNELSVDDDITKSAINKAQIIYDFCAGKITDNNNDGVKTTVPDKKVVTINGKKLEVPELELYCTQCETTNFFYDDNKPPYHCDNCKNPLDAETDRLSGK